MVNKNTINSTLFDAQNAGNRIFELLYFKFFSGKGEGGTVRSLSPRGKGPYGHFSGYSRLLHLQWPLITNVIETPDNGTPLYYFQPQGMVSGVLGTLPAGKKRSVRMVTRPGTVTVTARPRLMGDITATDTAQNR